MPKFAMSDARTFTDYKPSCDLNNMIKKKNNLESGHDYRHFLQSNASDLMKEFAQNLLPEVKVCPVCKLAVEQK